MSESRSGGHQGALTFDIDWSETVHVDGPVRAHIDRTLTISDDPNIPVLVHYLRFEGEFPDSRAEWHHNYTPIETWIRAHVFRKARGLNIQELADEMQETPSFAMAFGFFGDTVSNRPEDADPPGYTQLRDMWEEEFSERLWGACTVLAESLVEYARNQGLPAPDNTFLPERDVEPEEIDEDDPTIRELTTDKTVEVWKTAKPVILNHWYLKRHHNWQIPEHTFADAQAHLSAGEDLFPETGVGNLAVKGDHDHVHYPSTHRRELKKFDIEEIRELHRSVTKDLISRARRDGELVGKLMAAIDITKGHPWTGEREENEDGDNLEKWILGYANDNDQRPQYYFQWASIQIVGLDIPLVLDGVPVHRGKSREEIVRELLSSATDMVDDIELVMMDKGFDSEGVKNACEDEGVYYLNAASRSDHHKKQLNQKLIPEEAGGSADKREWVKIVPEEDRGAMREKEMPVRKSIYVPHVSSDDDEDDKEDEEGNEYRQQLLEDAGFVDEEQMEEDEDKRPMAGLMSQIHTEEEEEEDDDEDDDDPTEEYTVFETNHPDAWPTDELGESYDKREEIETAAWIVNRYGMRWGVENGYKKIKRFLPRSGSDDHVLRFFNFVWASTMYNCWRLVDLLVKLSVEDDPDYTPLVTAGRFREIAENHYGLAGLPPPDW